METIINFLFDHLFLSIAFSILLNILISIIGIIPSAFLTTINISLFGFIGSIIFGFIGESIGAAVSFLLYRKGFIKLEEMKKIPNFIHAYQLKNNLKSFILILLLRILPFIPSSVVTLLAAISSVQLILLTSFSQVVSGKFHL